jgi:hypothetical protein
MPDRARRPGAGRTSAPAVVAPAAVALAVAVAVGVGVGVGVASPAQAGPWNRELGSAYLKLGLSHFSATQGFSRGVATGLDYEAYTVELYGELGLPHRFSLVVNLPYVMARNGSPAGFVYGHNTLGDGRLELDFQVLESAPLSLGLELKVPLYRSVSASADDSLIEVDGRSYPAANFPDVGDANVDVTPKVLAGWSFAPLFEGWLTAELGYRVRLDGFADGVYGALGMGAFVWPRHVALGVLANGVVNVQVDRRPEEQATHELLFVQGYVLVTGAPWVPRLGVTLSVGGIVSAVNASEGTSLGVGLSYEL